MIYDANLPYDSVYAYDTQYFCGAKWTNFVEYATWDVVLERPTMTTHLVECPC